MTFSPRPTDKFFSVMDNVANIIGRPVSWLGGLFPDGTPVSPTSTIPLWKPITIAVCATILFPSAIFLLSPGWMMSVFFISGTFLLNICARIKLQHPLYRLSAWDRDEREQQTILTCRNSALVVMSAGAVIMPLLLAFTLIHDQFQLSQLKTISLITQAFLCLNYLVTLASAAQIGTLAWLERDQPSSPNAA